LETDLILSSIETGVFAIKFLPFTIGAIVSIVVLIVLLCFSALLSGSEVAFFSMTPSDIKEIEAIGNKNSHRILKHLKHPEQLLATILIGNNFVNVGIVILSAYITKSLIVFGEPQWLKVVVEVIGITAIILFFGEIMPKVYASRFSRRFAEVMAYPLMVLITIFKPLSSVLVATTGFVNKRVAKKTASISLDDISHALELTSDEISDEKDLLEGIVKFGNISAEEIMTARVDVIDIEITSSFTKVLSVIVESGYSRIPIYENTPDNVKGVLYVKDLLPYVNEKEDFEWQKLMRSPYFIPETKKIDDLLEEFQQNKVHLAIVVDEYGGTSGIVSLEDILEEIVGDISDEMDDDETSFIRQPDGTIIFEGKTLLNDFYKIVGVAESTFDNVKGEAETLAGLILEIRGAIPDKNEVVKFKSFIFTITSVDSRRIKKIKFEHKIKTK